MTRSPRRMSFAMAAKSSSLPSRAGTTDTTLAELTANVASAAGFSNGVMRSPNAERSLAASTVRSLPLQAGARVRFGGQHLGALESQSAFHEAPVQLLGPAVEEAFDAPPVVAHDQRYMVAAHAAHHGAGDQCEGVALPAVALRVAGCCVGVDIEGDLRRLDGEAAITSAGMQW